MIINKSELRRIAFIFAAFICLLPFVPSAAALLAGIIFALAFGNPYPSQTSQLKNRLLPFSIVGLGAGINLFVVLDAGFAGLLYSFAGIVFALAVGMAAGVLFKTEKNTSLLIGVGTAICGGSAIAAIAPVIKARDHEISVSLAIVFTLNAIALMVFPIAGPMLDLSQHQFGLWSALAIHDTSSVVGATMQYGAEALATGTTVKLARALWIVPLALAIGWLAGRKKNEPDNVKAKKPWFILGFLIMAAFFTWVPGLQEAGQMIEWIAKRLLVLTLFLIGAGLSRETFRTIGPGPIVHGFLLWIVVALASLIAILQGWIV